jgi:aldehyde dehydrogenase (NAD+)
VKAGTIWINSTNLFDAAAGFGGYKESGYGREGGREGMYDVLVETPHAGAAKTAKTAVQADANEVTLPAGVDRTYRFLIGGKLARPDGAGSYAITSPSGALLAVVGDANRKDLRNAVEAARGAFPSWFESAAHLRAQILYFWAENLAAEKTRFAASIAAQTGSPLATAEAEVDAAVSRLFDFAAYADKFGGTVQPVLGRRMVVGLREPLGVIGMRAPDESPLLGLISILGPALAMANTAVVIAGAHALTAMELVQTIQHSDIPSGVINILTAQNPEALAKELAAHEDIDSVWFFGSQDGSTRVEEASISNMKQTWVSNGVPVQWETLRTEKLLLKSTQVKNIWVPYGA